MSKGNKGGKGRLQMPDELRGCKLMNQREVELLLNRHMKKSVKELVKFAQDDKNEVQEVLVARILVEAIRSGDQNRFEFVLNRLLGKPKEVVEHNHKVSYHDEIMRMIEETEEENAKDVTPKLGYATK